MDNKVTTGIKGLDQLLNGGIPKGSVVLASGAPGTGKSILGMQFLEEGVKKKEKCVYVSIEEKPEKIKRQAAQFGLFKKLPEMISARDIRYDAGARKPDTIEDKIKLVLEMLKKMGPDRVVIDSISSLSFEDGLTARQVTRELVSGLNDLGLTTIMTGEALEGDYPDKYTPFLVDGVMVLQYLQVGSTSGRNFFIQKMRETKHSEDVHPLEITNRGLVIKPAEEAYNL